MTEQAHSALAGQAAGYLSREHKKRFQLLAGIWGGVFILLQLAAPLLSMMVMLPSIF